MRQISLALERDSSWVTLLWLSQTTLDWILDWRLSRFRRARFNWYPSFVSHHIRATFTIVYIVLHREHRTVWNFFCILEARGRFQNLLWYLGRSLGEDKWPFGRHHSNSLRCHHRHHRHIRHHHHPGHHHQVLQLVAQQCFFFWQITNSQREYRICCFVSFKVKICPTKLFSTTSLWKPTIVICVCVYVC